MDIIRHDERRAITEVAEPVKGLSLEEIVQGFVLEVAELEQKVMLYKAELEANADVFDNHGMTVHASQTRCFLVRTSNV